MIERLKLTVAQVKDVQRVGEKQKEKLTFLAHGEDGKEKSYSTMRTSLFDAIRNNKDFEADVEETERESGGTIYTNRNVSEVYVDGKAMGAAKGQGSRQWGGKSPEEIASIEAQVAAKLAMEGWIAGKFDDKSSIVLGLEFWIDKRLSMSFPKDVKELLGASASEKVSKPLENGVPKSEDIDMSPVKNKGDLFTRCKKYWDLNKSQALDKMGGQWEVDLEDPDAAWQQVCTVMKDEKEETHEA